MRKEWNFKQSPTPNRNGFPLEVVYEVERNGNLYNDGEQYQGDSKSVSSTDDAPADVQVSHEVVPESRTETQKFCIEKPRWKNASKLVLCLLFTPLAVFTSFMWIDGQDAGYHLVPT